MTELTPDKLAQLQVETRLPHKRTPVCPGPAHWSIMCADGSMWSWGVEGWGEEDPIPGSPRALELEAEDP